MVKLGGLPSDPSVRRHLEFSIAAGFNAVWIYSHEAGRWTAEHAPDGPFLFPSFVDLTRACRRRGVRVFVSVNPVADSLERFVFSEAAGETRIVRFLDLLRRKAWIEDFVVSFDDQPTRLEELSDFTRYGPSAAPAHLDLTMRLEKAIRLRESIWLCAAAYCDPHLGDGSGVYARSFLEGLGRLQPRVGIVWTGTSVASRSIDAADIAATRARLGGRRILLYDNYPQNDDSAREALGLVLGPLRRRDGDLPLEVAVYLACPMHELAASRLTLLTTAEYLSAPERYDAEASWRRAVTTLAGVDEATWRALQAQAREWGGAPGEAGYQHIDDSNPDVAAADLGEAAAAADWEKVARDYPARMAALAGLADHEFRDELIETMSRRLAVAQAFPYTREILATGRGDGDPASAVASLKRLRESLSAQPNSLRVVDLFLESAGVPIPKVTPPRAP